MLHIFKKLDRKEMLSNKLIPLENFKCENFLFLVVFLCGSPYSVLISKDIFFKLNLNLFKTGQQCYSLFKLKKNSLLYNIIFCRKENVMQGGCVHVKKQH